MAECSLSLKKAGLFPLGKFLNIETRFGIGLTTLRNQLKTPNILTYPSFIPNGTKDQFSYTNISMLAWLMIQTDQICTHRYIPRRISRYQRLKV